MRLTIARIVALQLFLSASLPAQKNSDWRAVSSNLLTAGAYEEAAAFTDSLARVFEKKRQRKDELDALAKFAYANAYGQKKFFNTLDRLEEATSHLNPATLSVEEAQSLIPVYNWMAWTAKQTGDFVRVKRTLENALSVVDKRLNGRDDKNAGFLFLDLGNAYARLGEFESAKIIFERSIRYSLEYNLPSVAKYNDYGTMYHSTGQDSVSLAIYRRGMNHPGLPLVEKIILKLGEAESLVRLGQPAPAQNANDQAEKLIRNLPEDDDRYLRCLFGLKENYALIAFARQDYPQAKANFEQAIQCAVRDEARRDAAGFYHSLAEVYLAWKKPQQALEACQKAIDLLLPGAKYQTGQLLREDHVQPENILIRILTAQAEAYLQQNNPETALSCYERIPLVEARLRETHDYESSSLIALQASRARFNRAMDIAWDLFARSNDPRFAAKAFHFSELARGLLLVNTLARARADYVLPERLRRLENNLETRIAWYSQNILESRLAQDSLTTHRLEKELFAVVKERDGLRQTFRDSFPEYALLIDHHPAPAWDEVRQCLQTGQAMFSFFINETHLYIFRFFPSGESGWRRETLPADFRDNTVAMFEFLRTLDDSRSGRISFQKNAFALFKLLLEPDLRADRSMQSLIIVPDNVLSFIPFEVLLTKSYEGNWQGAPYMLQRYDISYAYSATSLRMRQQISRSRKPAARILAGFAPSYHHNTAPTGDQQVAMLMREGMYNLEGTHREVDNICRIMGGDPFQNDSASEAHFKKIAGEYRILLLSMHGLADEEHPERSRFLFGDPLSEGAEDNVLYASELQIMSLRADLAVLSACHTGYGRFYQGEGVYSLARSFAAASVPSTLLSLWRLSDKTAPDLLEPFFINLKKGLPKDKALAQAKRRFLSREDHAPFAHPAFWSGLIANGDMRPLVHEPVPSWLLFALAMLIVSGLVYWLFRKSRMFAPGNRF